MQHKFLLIDFIKAKIVFKQNLAMAFIKSYSTIFIAALLTLFTSPQVFSSAVEHQSVLNLVPLTAVSRQVGRSGSWSNPATWSGGILPKPGENIYVPAGRTLQVDVFSDASLGTVRVDGVIKFATNKNVRIKIDTLVVTSTGSFEIGSELARVGSANKVEIVVANNGPINRTWDPINISRGIILQGKTRVFGAEKSAYHLLAVDPAAGSTQIQLATVPTGWAKGDIIAITATKFRSKTPADTNYQTEDELRRINAIAGNTITLGDASDSSKLAPLTLSHIPAIAKMPVYVANLTRNVVFSGEGGNAVPAGQRGHFMVMHQPNVIIKGAGFYFLGRTDKSVPLDDFLLGADEKRITNALGQEFPGANTNPRGRYAVHFHHTGTNIATPPVVCAGNAVFGSAGWGFVNHTSNVLMENNASYDVYGSHFVSEDGNELGSFKHNIAIKSEGRDGSTKEGFGNHDHGHTGHGFWLHSRNMALDDNVVSGVRSSGLVYYHRNIIVPDAALEIPRQNLLTVNKLITKGYASINYGHIPITHQKNMTVLSSGSVLNVIKATLGQGHDVRNMFESLKGYSVPNGLQLQYTDKYTFRDLEIIADPFSNKWSAGVNVSINDKDIVFDNSNVEGFLHPFVTGRTFKDGKQETDVEFVNVLVDGRPINPINDIQMLGSENISDFNPSVHKILGPSGGNLADQIALGTLSFVPLTDAVFSTTNPVTGLTVSGIKTDSLGAIVFESKWKSILPTVKQGYYTRPDGSKVLLLKDYITDRLTGEVKQIVTQVNLLKTHTLIGPHLGVLAK